MAKKRELKMKPSDYPLFAVRLNNEDQKDHIDVLIEKALQKANKRVKKEELKIKKNEVVYEALVDGLNRYIKKLK